MIQNLFLFTKIGSGFCFLSKVGSESGDFFEGWIRIRTQISFFLKGQIRVKSTRLGNPAYFNASLSRKDHDPKLKLDLNP